MKFLFLDLEFNQPSRKIIQLGACVADFNTGQICDELRLFVNPQEKISQPIIDLTGIRQNQVDRGLTIEEAYLKLKHLNSKYSCELSPFTWGEDDCSILKVALEKNGVSLNDWPFGFRSNNVQTIFFGHAITHRMSTQGGLQKSMHRLGLKFFGKRHDALDDAKNTFLIAYYLLKNKNKSA